MEYFGTFLCLLVLASADTAVGSTDGTNLTKALAGFVNLTINRQTYWFSNTSVNETTARNKCAEINAELAFFDTNFEYWAVEMYMDAYVKNDRNYLGRFWVRIFAGDTNNDNYYEHFWRTWDPVTVWGYNEPNSVCTTVSYSDPCCVIIDVASSTRGLRDYSNGNLFTFLCKPVNECSRWTSKCTHICLDNDLGYDCSCRSGYSLASDGYSCVDVDECNTTRPCQQACANTQGSYMCSCYRGYSLALNNTCVDVDECSTTEPCQQACVNTQGSYTCHCYTGYEMSPNNTCVDVDECSATLPCDQVCVNTVGSFNCMCNTGYTLIQNNMCVDVDECLSNPCDQMCTNTNGSYICTCDPGFILALDGMTCNDVDECLSTPCHQMCDNTAGSFSCFCNEGFSLSNDSKTCVDINECENSPCQHMCNNTEGSFLCSCQQGYTLGNDNYSCVDVDECNIETVCNSTCNNTLGSYVCICPIGYVVDGPLCLDIDECSGSNNCSDICTNTEGSYKCSCTQGYSLNPDNWTCADVNECTDGTNDCDQTCTNIPSSYLCSCQPGYRLDTTDNKTCHDIDECQENQSICHQICINTPGSYACSCFPGYTLSPNSSCVESKSLHKCPCSCLYAKLQQTPINPKDVLKKVENIETELKVNTKFLSSFTNRLNSAEDRRPSSESIGVVGIVMLVFTLGIIIIPDILTGCALILRFVQSFKP